MVARKEAEVLRVGRVRLRVPRAAEVLEARDLDEVFSQGPARADALVLLRSGGVVIAAVVEDTGRPEPRDLERLDGTVDNLRRMGLIGPGAVILKVLHHRGLGPGSALLVSLARSRRVELQECRSGGTDLASILRRRGLLPRPS